MTDLPRPCTTFRIAVGETGFELKIGDHDLSDLAVLQDGPIADYLEPGDPVPFNVVWVPFIVEAALDDPGGLVRRGTVNQRVRLIGQIGEQQWEIGSFDPTTKPEAPVRRAPVAVSAPEPGPAGTERAEGGSEARSGSQSDTAESAEATFRAAGQVLQRFRGLTSGADRATATGSAVDGER
jgi:hypothetical protein